MNDPEGSPILAIIYHNNIPFSVWTENDCYDFEWCERDEICAYHSSGNYAPDVGPYADGWRKPITSKIWVRPSVRLHATRYKKGRWRGVWNEIKTIHFTAKSARRKLARWGYKVIETPVVLGEYSATPNPFDWFAACEGRAEYCHICNCWHLDNQWSGQDRLCDHIEWCEECEIWQGPGHEEGSCGCHEKFMENAKSVWITESIAIVATNCYRGTRSWIRKHLPDGTGAIRGDYMLELDDSCDTRKVLEYAIEYQPNNLTGLTF